MKLISILILLTTCCLGLSAQGNQVLENLAQDSALPFTFLNGQFEGPGWDELLEQARSHKYFLLGEDHGAAEIPALTAALAGQIAFDAFVVEVDSATTGLLSELAKKPKAEIQDFQNKYPSALSFYSAIEELALYVDTPLKDAEHWGLDQVSLFSTGVVLRRLSELAVSDRAKNLSRQLATLSDSLFSHAYHTGYYDTLFIYSTQSETFTELQEVFANESKDAKAILNDLELSWKIQTGNGASHTDRLALMKRRFLNYYIDARRSGHSFEHVLLKFGANHMSKAESLLGHHDVGNFVANLAQSEFEKSYHLMVIGAKGHLNTFIPTEGMTQSEFDITDKTHDLNYLSPFLQAVPENSWAFFDLKPMRKALKQGQIKTTHKWLHRTLMGFDGLIIASDFTPSHLPEK